MGFALFNMLDMMALKIKIASNYPGEPIYFDKYMHAYVYALNTHNLIYFDLFQNRSKFIETFNNQNCTNKWTTS